MIDTLKASVSRAKSALSPLLIALLGTGVYRAWIELLYVRPDMVLPTHHFAGHDFYDLVMCLALVVGALVGKKIAPLNRHAAALIISGICMTAATILNLASMYDPSIAPYVAYWAAGLGGFGTAIIIILWAEIFSAISPYLVAIYYSASMIVGAAIVGLYQGLIPSYQEVLLCLLPVVSICMACLSYRRFDDAERPAQSTSQFHLPIKPMLAMALFAFAYGMNEGRIYQVAGPHSSWGVVVASLLVLIGLFVFREQVSLDVLVRKLLPILAAGSTIISLVPSMIGGGFISPAIEDSLVSFSSTFGYTAYWIFLTIVMSGVCYRFGVSAIWLFGLERGLRALVVMCGRVLRDVLFQGSLSSTIALSGTPSLLVNAQVIEVVTVVVTAALLVVFAWLVASQGTLTFDWGFEREPKTALDSRALYKRQVSDKIAHFTKTAQLTPREVEVLQLLVAGKSIKDVERELVIARGTAKAHINHIYQKLEIHCREELFEIFEIPQPGAPSQH